MLPRSQGEWGWAKYTGSPVAVMVACRAISVPRSPLSDRRIAAGRPSTAATGGLADGEGVSPGQGHQDEEPGHAFDQGRDRGLAVLADDQSGSPGALLRRGPLRTARAAFTAGSSSKPQGRLRVEV
ncbi:MAG: hypothetical protein LC799_20475, partial [Actinobacteria bacterium]|nr:hypothetical protein [Actinomycetota bacterium]